jgi:hypothetical protein
MGGDISYMTPRGAPHAWFRINLPQAGPAESSLRVENHRETKALA